jgi:hypothetical protein
MLFDAIRWYSILKTGSQISFFIVGMLYQYETCVFEITLENLPKSIYYF